MKRTVKFDLFPKKVNGVLVESRPIRMRVSYAGNRVDIRLGYSISADKWEVTEGRVIAGAKNRYKQTAGEINKAILNSESQVEEIFTRYELLEKRIPTTEEVKAAFDEIAGRNRNPKNRASNFMKPTPNLWKLWAGIIIGRRLPILNLIPC